MFVKRATGEKLVDPFLLIREGYVKKLDPLILGSILNRSSHCLVILFCLKYDICMFKLGGGVTFVEPTVGVGDGATNPPPPSPRVAPMIVGLLHT